LPPEPPVNISSTRYLSFVLPFDLCHPHHVLKSNPCLENSNIGQRAQTPLNWMREDPSRRMSNQNAAVRTGVSLPSHADPLEEYKSGQVSSNSLRICKHAGRRDDRSTQLGWWLRHNTHTCSGPQDSRSFPRQHAANQHETQPVYISRLLAYIAEQLPIQVEQAPGKPQAPHSALNKRDAAWITYMQICMGAYA
jgi:hypothetical protein